MIAVVSSGVRGRRRSQSCADSLFAVGTVVAVVIGYLLDRRTLPDYGLGFDRQWWRDAAFGLLLGAGLPALVLLAELAVGFVEVSVALTTIDSGPLPLPRSDRRSPSSFGSVLPRSATAEEVLVRGYLLTNAAEGLAGWIGKRRAILSPADDSLFGVLRCDNPCASLLSGMALYGLLLGAVRPDRSTRRRQRPPACTTVGYNIVSPNPFGGCRPAPTTATGPNL